MSVKPWVAFTTSLPDDQVEDGQQIFVLGGRNVAVAIGEIFTRLGCEVSPPESAGELGWEFDLRDKEHYRFWCRVTSFYPSFHLLFEGPGGLFGGKKNSAAHAELSERFAAALKDDRRFQHISWWSMNDGPPEPEEIASIGQRRQTAGILSSPVELHGSQPALTSSQLGCISGVGWLLIVWGGLGAFVALDYTIRLGGPWHAMSVSVLILGAGLLLVLLARARRADS